MTRNGMMEDVINRLGENHKLTVNFFVIANSQDVPEKVVIDFYKFILEITKEVLDK